MNKQKVLFVCIHNSGRSQMAEALLRHSGGEHFEAESAGLEPGTLNPIVVEVMNEIGIDISQARTKSVFDLHEQGRTYQFVVTVCDESKAESCPIFPGLVRARMHWSFQDPSRFKGSHEVRLAKTRVVRDRIKAKIGEFIKLRVADQKRKGGIMKKLVVYDPAMCCSSGVCGPSVDPLLSRFSADLDWLSGQKVVVTRYNLSQEPKAFASDPMVSAALKKEGPDCLPLIVTGGKIVSKKKYPSRSQLAAWAGVPLTSSKTPAPPAACCAPKKSPQGRPNKGCC